MVPGDGSWHEPFEPVMPRPAASPYIIYAVSIEASLAKIAALAALPILAELKFIVMWQHARLDGSFSP